MKMKIGNHLSKNPDKKWRENGGKHKKMWEKMSKNASKMIVSQLKHRWKC